MLRLHLDILWLWETQAQCMMYCCRTQSSAEEIDFSKYCLAASVSLVSLQCSRFDEAEVLYKQAEKALGHCLGRFHPALASVLTDWGLLKAVSGKSVEAAQLLRWVLHGSTA